MNDVQSYGHEYVADEWPHGLRCAECDRLLGEGDRWASKLEAFQGDTPILLIVCLECALNPNEDS